LGGESFKTESYPTTSDIIIPVIADRKRLIIMEIKYLFYFIIGGTIISVVTYLANHAKGLLAASIANLPVITLITFLAVYTESGSNAVISYAEGLLIMLIPWLAYIFSVIGLSNRLGFIPSLLLGVSLYLLIAYLIIRLRTF
jgi:uncharacterized membrane protein (GlpM family)